MEDKDVVLATKHCEGFLKREERNIVTFTGDSTLSYIPSKDTKRFSLKPKEAAIYLPVLSFIDNSFDDQIILWLLYKELALYPDWQQNPSQYLNRMQCWEYEMQKMVSYMMEKIEREGFADEPLYDRSNIQHYVRREVLEFIHCFDELSGVMRVLDYCPVYRQTYYSKQIQKYFSSKKIAPETIKNKPSHKAFCAAFLCKLIFETDPPMNEGVEESFCKMILGRALNEVT